LKCPSGVHPTEQKKRQGDRGGPSNIAENDPSEGDAKPANQVGSRKSRHQFKAIFEGKKTVRSKSCSPWGKRWKRVVGPRFKPYNAKPRRWVKRKGTRKQQRRRREMERRGGKHAKEWRGPTRRGRYRQLELTYIRGGEKEFGTTENGIWGGYYGGELLYYECKRVSGTRISGEKIPGIHLSLPRHVCSRFHQNGTKRKARS